MDYQRVNNMALSPKELKHLKLQRHTPLNGKTLPKSTKGIYIPPTQNELIRADFVSNECKLKIANLKTLVRASKQKMKGIQSQLDVSNLF